MKLTRKTFFSSAGVMILTTVHHVYGAIIYDSAFRLHVAYFAIPVIAVLTLSYWICRKNQGTSVGRIATGVFTFVTIIFSVGAIGFYEGGYNHVLKNILYFGGVDRQVIAGLYPPPPLFELPNDFWFEATGVGQFFLGVYTLLTLNWLLPRNRKTAL